MALSPNYSWAEPDNSSLVKNGASDIRTLGDAIDTSVWNIGFGQAGKNKIINGDFFVNQRNFSSTTSGGYGFDRFTVANVGGTVTYSAQTFSVGNAPVSGYNARSYARVLTSGQSAAGDLSLFYQPIENVGTLAGQTVTYSFWAKAASGTPKISLETEQTFGIGGSPSANVDTYQGQVTLSTSWARYSVTFTMPSISGKTLGNTSGSVYVLMWLSAGSSFNSRTNSLGIQNNTIDIWGVQLEAGSVATAFQTATGTIQGELAACQRYYYYLGVPFMPVTSTSGGTTVQGVVSFPVTMRIAPTASTNMTNANYDSAGPGAGKWCFNVPGTGNSTKTGTATIAQYTSLTGSSFVSTGATYSPVPIGVNVSSTSYLDFSAEL